MIPCVKQNRGLFVKFLMHVIYVSIKRQTLYQKINLNTKATLVALYDFWLGNGLDLFLQAHKSYRIKRNSVIILHVNNSSQITAQTVWCLSNDGCAHGKYLIKDVVQKNLPCTKTAQNKFHAMQNIM